MARYVALLRGINVGGKNLIKMTALKQCFEEAGFTDVATYIQSGNVVFSGAGRAAELTSRIERALSSTFGMEIKVVVRSAAQLAAIVDAAPKGFGMKPALYRYDVIFLKEPLTAEKALADVPRREGVDEVAAGKGVLYYWRLTSRATQSKLNRVVGMPMYKNMTIRNWNTTTKLAALLACLAWAVGCSTTTPDAVVDSGTVQDVAVDVASDAPVTGCDAPVTAPPPGLDPFYAKYLDAEGVPVISSSKVSDEALRVACRITRTMISFRADVREQMKAHQARVAVMARTEVTTDIPEHKDLYTVFPGTDWDMRARGLGGTVDRPATSCAEENVLCDATDRYRGENILVHELAHGIANLGVAFADKTFMRRLKTAHTEALAAGKWMNTYAATNVDEYFAEGVQSYFETNIEITPPNGIHNEINTRKELEGYDGKLYGLVAEVFGPAVWTPGCP